MSVKFVILSNRILLVGCLLLSLSGCSGEGSKEEVTPPECLTDEDCGTGRTCSPDGKCLSLGCLTSEDCPVGLFCHLGACQSSIPADGDKDRPTDQAEEEPGCRVDSDCLPGWFCPQSGECRLDDGTCVQTRDCPVGEVCLNLECVERQTDGDEETPLEVEVDEPEIDDSEGDLSTEEEAEAPPKDTDHDCIPDYLEDKNGNGEWDRGEETDFRYDDTDDDGIKDGQEDKNCDGLRQFNETDPRLIDTDYDKLEDGEEDTDHDGIWEEERGETDPLNIDTDEDGIMDGDELSGGYDGRSSNPLKKDTDDDTLPDGLEDKNLNGIYEPELGETDPTREDSDGDGIPDGEESVSLICTEEEITALTLYLSASGGWTLALLPDYTYTPLDLAPVGNERLYGAAFEDPANGIAGFILARDTTHALAQVEVAADNDTLDVLAENGALNHRGRQYASYDSFDAMTSHYKFTATQTRTVGELRNEALSLLSGRSAGSIVGLPAGPSESTDEFDVMTETLVRDEENASIVIFTVITSSRYASTSDTTARYRITDLTDGSALATFDVDTLSGCDPSRGARPGKVDFIWVVDNSGSMSEDQQAVSDAASQFSSVMSSAGIDYRVAVTGTGCIPCPYSNPILCQGYTPGVLADHKFTSSVSEFQSDVTDIPCSGDEYGIWAGWSAISAALDSTKPENERLRPDASLVVIYLSDEEDQEYEDCSNATCQTDMLTRHQGFYDSVNAVCFAIVGDMPSGCGGGQASSGPGSGEAGSAYIEMAYHSGGSFGSICAGDLTPTMNDILRAAAGTASTYELTHHPISSSLQVMVDGHIVERSTQNGFEFDVVADRIVFYGTARPAEGKDVVASYRYFDDDPKGDRR